MFMSILRGAAALALLALVQPSMAFGQSNDDWVNAKVIASLPYADIALDTTSATVEGSDPPSICFVGAVGSTGRATVWYRYTTGPQVEYLNLSTQGSGYDTIVNVYTGEPGSFRQVMGGCNDDGVGTTQSLIAGLRVQPSTSYSFEVLSHGSVTVGGNLNFAVTAAPLYNVTVLNDAALNVTSCPGPVCSLRAAVRKSNTVPGAILLPAGTFQMTIAGSSEDAAATGDLDVRASMGLYGAGVGQSIIDPTATLSPGTFSNERVFDVDPDGFGANAASGRVTAIFADVEIRNGGGASFFGDGGAIRAYSSSTGSLVNNDFIAMEHVKISGSRSALNGGAFADSGRVMIADSEFSGNTAGSTGGALTLGPSIAGGDSVVEIVRSLIANNTSTGGFSGGGGIKSTSGLRLVDSTVAGNSSPYHGGGIYLTGTATVEIRSSTIANNRAASGGSGSANGGGVRVDGGVVNLSNSILGNNERGTVGTAVGDDCTAAGGTLNGGYDLIESSTCAFSGTNLTGVDAGLAAIANNGGAFNTIALLDGSPALDAADPAGCNSYLGDAIVADQRGAGYARVSNGRCDIGAFERQVAASATTPGTPDLRTADDTGDSSLDNLTQVTIPGFTGTCTNGDTVTLLVDGSVTTNSSACSGGNYAAFLTGALSEGSHSIAAQSSQGASTSSASAPLTIVVDSTAPGIAITSAPSGTVVDSTATFNFSAEAGAHTNCRLDSGASATCTSPTTLAGLGEGTHQWTVKATDAAGNFASASVTWTVAAPPVPQAPTLDAASDSGVSNSDGITNADPLEFIGNCVDGDSVFLAEAGTPLGSAVTCSGGYHISLSGVGEGAHTITAQSQRNGLTSVVSLSTTAQVDRHADPPSLLGPGGVVSPDVTVNGITENSAQVTVSEGAAVLCVTTAAADGTWNCSVHIAAGGLHHLTATALDVAGNASSASNTLDLDIDSIFRDSFEG